MSAAPVAIRKVDGQSLAAVNAVIEGAVARWDLPERVKRLALSSYRYTPLDLSTITVVAAYCGAALVGVAAWEPLEDGGLPTMLLHGLYVAPDHWGKGIGSRLLEHAEQAARESGYGMLAVKAQAGARGFFLQRGFTPAGSAAAGDYAHLLSKSLGHAQS